MIIAVQKCSGEVKQTHVFLFLLSMAEITGIRPRENALRFATLHAIAPLVSPIGNRCKASPFD